MHDCSTCRHKGIGEFARSIIFLVIVLLGLVECEGRKTMSGIALIDQFESAEDVQSLVNILAIRWEIETFFEHDKDLLGSDQYLLMFAKAIVRFWILTSCLICFLKPSDPCSLRSI